MYINLHTHHYKPIDGIQIYNRLAGEWMDEIYTNTFFSSGVHPWYTADFTDKLEALIQLAENKKIVAIGECGLDVHSGKFAEQKTIFRMQIAISEKYQLPIIIHCVKSFNELIRIHKSINPTQPWIIHGFNASHDVALQCLKFENIYLSFGEAMFSPTSKVHDAIQKIDLNRFFIETDESNRSIDELYSKFAEIRGEDLENIKNGIVKNYKHIFGSFNSI